jgi:hypothetical protein
VRKSSERPKETIRRNWFESVYELSDLGLQRRTWLDSSHRNPHWSYVEFVCSFPDEKQIDDAVLKEILSADEARTMRELWSKLSSHRAPGGNGYDHAAILEDPAWHEVVSQAERTRQQLLNLVSDAAEKEALTNEPTFTIYVTLLDEGTNVWRPVEAVCLGGGLYRIVSTPPRDEHWQFTTGQAVQREPRRFSDREKALVAAAAADRTA